MAGSFSRVEVNVDEATGLRTVVLRFPAPSVPLSINDYTRLHWSQRRRRLDCWRDETHLEARAAGLAELRLGPSSVKVVLPFSRNAARRDPHNYTSTTVKSIVDGLIAGGVWVDDTADYVSIVDPVLVIQPAKDRPLHHPFGEVRIVVVELSQPAAVETQEALL